MSTELTLDYPGVVSENAAGSADYVFYPGEVFALGRHIQKFKREFKCFYRQDEDLKRVVPESSMLALMSLYSHMSGRSAEEMSQEGSLAPAVLIYDALAVKLDDAVDGNSSISIMDSYRNGSNGQDSPENQVNRGLALIADNAHLRQSEKAALSARVNQASLAYVNAEIELSKLGLKKPSTIYAADQQLVTTLALYHQGFGGLARTLTALLNGGEFGQPDFIKLEEKMEAVCLATTILDCQRDVRQDLRSPRSLTPVTAAREVDRVKGLVIGTTERQLSDRYEKRIGNRPLASAIKFYYELELRAEKK